MLSIIIEEFNGAEGFEVFSFAFLLQFGCAKSLGCHFEMLLRGNVVGLIEKFDAHSQVLVGVGVNR
jgi:hypothetical protein